MHRIIMRIFPPKLFGWFCLVPHLLSYFLSFPTALARLSLQVYSSDGWILKGTRTTPFFLGLAGHLWQTEGASKDVIKRPVSELAPTHGARLGLKPIKRNT